MGETALDKNLSQGLSYKLHNGHFVNARVQQICHAIQEYEPELDVMYLPEARREGKAAYRIVHRPANGEPYILFTVRRDEDFDERILQRIIANDQRHAELTWDEVEAKELAEALVKKQEWQDQMDEANDIAKHVLKSHLNKYVVDKKKNIVIEDRGGIF